MAGERRRIRLLIFLFSSLFAWSATSDAATARTTVADAPNTTAGRNPFTPEAALIRYWRTRVSADRPPPPFLLSKASPLSAAASALLAKLAAGNSLSSHLRLFCSLANLFCSFDEDLSSDRKDLDEDANFAVYSNKRFSGYGTGRLGGADSFKNYSEGLNTPNFSFKKYTKEGSHHSEGFANYASEGNVANGSFASYGFGANGGSGEFKNYHRRVNVPNLLFTTYDSDANDHKLAFASYSDDTNSGSQSFTSYAKHGNSAPTQFVTYGDDSNTIASAFTGYGLLGNAGNDTFTSYGGTGNDPHSTFKSYGAGGNSGTQSFASYRNGANVGDDSFQSYARNANSAKTTFATYGKSFNPANDTFKEYGKGSKGQTAIEFKSYSVDRQFKDYAQKGVRFAGYSNVSSASPSSRAISGSSVNRWVEPGRFFRESALRPGNVMQMPDIVDKMPRRSFLPRVIASKLPFSTRRLRDVKEVFGAREGSATEGVILAALRECERPPSRGETKRCVGSAEDMVDFAASVLGRGITARTTESVNGSKRRVVIGAVGGINGGEATESVSCHQSLYPYLLYYCHSVPKVRVYEAEILEFVGRSRINRGVAICHLDTSSWSPAHGAFVALGSGPGQIEVCHWIFENDVTWTAAD
ncbi:polygalacturonase 1 beta-like protein 3 [Rhodamnia argentea]|uniref:Polygalacturonase 1 beta-like protein 3 n=1 Tax=Rhodamnia argentea TaxID=178133 RepID=A0A8B8P9G5_9MYRT|nr:polygalacturonase 1 beta-like protein 3 [Rhodamnia argentea]